LKRELRQSDMRRRRRVESPEKGQGAFHLNNHAGAAPAQIGMKTGRRKTARFLVKSA